MQAQIVELQELRNQKSVSHALLTEDNAALKKEIEEMSEKQGKMQEEEDQKFWQLINQVN